MGIYLAGVFTGTFLMTLLFFTIEGGLKMKYNTCRYYEKPIEFCVKEIGWEKK